MTRAYIRRVDSDPRTMGLAAPRKALAVLHEDDEMIFLWKSGDGLTDWTVVGGAGGGGTFTGFGDDNSIVSLTAGRKLGVGSTADPNDVGGSQMWIQNFGSATRSAQLYVFAADTGRTATDSTSIYVNNQTLVDTTAGAVQCVGIRIICDPSKTAGANSLNNVGLLIDTNAGDTNQAIWVTHGTVKFDEDCLFGPTTIVGAFTHSGGAASITGTAGSSITLSGTNGNITTGGAINCTGQIQTGGNVRLEGNTLWFTGSPTTAYIYTNAAGTSGNTSIDIMAGGSGVVRVNANTDGTANTGTGGFEVWQGGNSANKILDINGGASGSIVFGNYATGFHGVAAVARETVTGSRASGAALTDLLSKLANKGLIVDGSSA